LYFLAHFYIKTLKKVKKILVIIQRSNGDVFLSSSLISFLYEHYELPEIDLLVNDDTYSIAKTLPHINSIHQFSYLKKKENRWEQEKNIIRSIFRKYDLSINLTASDRSVIYALFASSNSISAVEKVKSKSWWKRVLLSYYYYYDSNRHVLLNNLESLNCLNIKHENMQHSQIIDENSIKNIEKKLSNKGIDRFIIFHPSAQYHYKIYPQHLRNELLENLNNLGVSIIVTGSKNQIDSEISADIVNAPNIYNFIGLTSIKEYFALSQLSLAYIGMDTLNMHIAASQNKKIFAIFGPTNLNMWAPWSNIQKYSAKENKPIQSYGNITIFQADMPCVACGNAGCDNNGISECLYNINPLVVFNEVKKWYKNQKK